MSRSGDFATLSLDIRRAGLLERRRVYYLIKIVLNLAVFAASWVVFVAIGDSWWQLVMAVWAARTIRPEATESDAQPRRRAPQVHGDRGEVRRRGRASTGHSGVEQVNCRAVFGG